MITDIKKSSADLEHAPEGAYRVEYASAADGACDWAVVCPRTLRTWIVNLHGHGSGGDQLFTRRDIREAWLPRFLAAGAGIVCPNLRDNAWMSPAAAGDLHDLLDYLRSAHAAERFIFFGGSMGGTGNLLYASLHPEDVDACVALGAATDIATFYDWCARQPAESMARRLGEAVEKSYGCRPAENPSLFDRHSTVKNCDRLTVPVFFAHGQADKLIPVSQARMLADKMSGCENFTYIEIPDGEHDSPLFIYAAAEFLDRNLR